MSERDSRKEFGLIAEIDFLYFQLRQWHGQRKLPTSGLAAMIDKATGYADFQLESDRKEVRRIFKQIRARKKKLGMDVTDIDEFLEQTKKAVAL